MKKFLSILCAMAVAGSVVSIPCFAEETMENEPVELSSDYEIAPYYISISSISPSIIAYGSGVGVSVSCYYASSCTAKMTVNLQRSSNNSSWSKTMGFGTTSGSGGSVSMSDSASVNSGYYYRVQAIVTIYNGSSVVETATQYSNSVYIG